MATTYMLCRNRVRDFGQWKSVFDSDREAHVAAGLTLRHLWRDQSDGDNFWFVFEVASIAQARAFIADPESARKGELAGVLDGEWQFVDDAGGYSG